MVRAIRMVMIVELDLVEVAFCIVEFVDVLDYVKVWEVMLKIEL